MTTVSPAASTTTGGTAERAGVKLAENFDNFLKLLTTQLQYQDPLEPMDSNQFTQQLVSFTGVEQSIATNKNLETLIANSQMNALSTASSYIGRQVVANDNRTLLDADGASWSLDLNAEAASVTLSIRDAAGRLVAERPGPTSRGTHEIVWDGRDDVGNQLPAGTYSLQVAARNRLDQAVQTRISVVGEVDSVELADGTARLVVDGTPISIGQITSVGMAQNPQDAAR